jgi:ubiquinone/menaquinone biosynthesis C-methylase UbiE
MDAEQMDFKDEQFDFVWSWGVIHHSARPERIVRQVHRVLKPSGQFRVMVYHRRSLARWLAVARGALSGKFFQGMSLFEVMSFYADGYVARFYSRSEFSALLRVSGFQTVVTRVLGGRYELVPLPGGGLSGRLKSILVCGIPDALAKPLLSRFGALLFATATK